MARAELEKPPVLLNNTSYYARLSGKRDAMLSPQDLGQKLKRLGYDSLSFADPTLFGLIPGRDAAGKEGLAWLPAIRLPIQTSDLTVHEGTFKAHEGIFI